MNTKYQFTPSDDFKAILAKKYRQLKAVLDAEEASLPMDGKTVHGFNLKGTEMVEAFTSKISDYAYRIAQEPEANAILDKYTEQFRSEFQADARNRIFLNMAFIESCAEFRETDNWSGDIEVARKLYSIICGSSMPGIKDDAELTEKFLTNLYDTDIEIYDCDYFSKDGIEAMETSQFIASTMAEIMAYPKTRKFLMESANKSDNATEHVTYVARLVSSMQCGSIWKTSSDDENDVINVATKIFFMLEDKLES